MKTDRLEYFSDAVFAIVITLLNRRSLLGPAAYVAAVAVGLAFPEAALAIFIGINVYFFGHRGRESLDPNSVHGRTETSAVRRPITNM